MYILVRPWESIHGCRMAHLKFCQVFDTQHPSLFLFLVVVKWHTVLRLKITRKALFLGEGLEVVYQDHNSQVRDCCN